jgi:hypothetical protein
VIVSRCNAVVQAPASLDGTSRKPSGAYPDMAFGPNPSDTPHTICRKVRP